MEEAEKSTMWRIPASIKASMELLLVEAQADPILCGQIGNSKGHISMAALLRLCWSKGSTSVKTEIRNRTPAPPAPVDKPMDKPTPKKKPAPKAKKKRR